MNYNIKGTGLEISDEIRSYIEKKLPQADKFLAGDSTAHADIECEYAQMRNGDKYRAEFTVEASGVLHRVESWGETLHAAIDLAIEELVQEIGRDKHKRLDVFRRSAVKVKDYLRGWTDRF